MKANVLFLLGIVALIAFFMTLGGTTPLMIAVSIVTGVVAITTLTASTAINLARIRRSRHAE